MSIEVKVADDLSLAKMLREAGDLLRSPDDGMILEVFGMVNGVASILEGRSMQIEQIIQAEFEDNATEFCLDITRETAGTSGNTYKNEITELHWVMWRRAWGRGK